MKKHFLLSILMFLPMLASADAVEINGIFYNLVSKAKEAEVTMNPNKYSGNIVIPETILYQNETYKVTKIGKASFFNCSGLNSIQLSNNVTEIDDEAFEGCTSLSELTIPNSVIAIGKWAFTGCVGLTSVNIPNSVTEIRQCGFSNCSNLSSIIIPNSITKLENLVFSGCTSLQTVTIPESVTTISWGVFYKCSGLTSVLIPNSVKTIGQEAFSGCNGLTSIEIPNSVTSIGNNAFSYCDGLTSVSIGNSIAYVKEEAFASCPNLEDVYCYAKSVPNTKTDAFKDSYIEDVTLHVPVSSIEDYKAAVPWSQFKSIVKINMPEHTLTYIVEGEVYKTYSIEEGETITPEEAPIKEGYTFSGWSEIPETMPANDVTITGTFSVNKYKLIYMVDGEIYRSYDIKYGSTIMPLDEPVKDGYTFSGWSEIPEEMPAHDVTITGTFTLIPLGKCASPTISVVDGKLHFESETPDVTFHYDITPLGTKNGDGNDIELSNTYKVTVYATKDRYTDSDVVTKEINISTMEQGKRGDLNGDGVVNATGSVILVDIIMGKE